MAAEAGELVDCGLGDAPAHWGRGLRGGRIAGGLDGVPEGHGMIALPQRRLGKADRRDKRANGNAHGPSPGAPTPSAAATEEVFPNGPVPQPPPAPPSCC